MDYLQERQNIVLEAQLDQQDYNEKDLISIKTPLTLPYYTSSKEFERIDGEIKVDGIIYKYVKRRIYKDTLEVLCITNKAKMKLASAEDDFFKLNNDLQTPHSSKKSSNSNNLKLSFFDYCNSIATFSIPELQGEVHLYSLFNASNYHFNSLFALGQPPELMQV